MIIKKILATLASTCVIAVSASAQCDSSLWIHVYHSYRLAVHNQCMTITGTVYSLIYEADGDIHIRLTVDSAYTYMLNDVNYSGQRGRLVLEPICVSTITQASAVSACSGVVNRVYIPNVGERVWATGSYVTDNDHGWNELHPLTSISLTPPNAVTTVNNNVPEIDVFPNPASTVINFRLQAPSPVPMRITILNELGETAGQYQMMQSRNLEVNLKYLPAGKYFYHIEEEHKYIRGGSFVVIH